MASEDPLLEEEHGPWERVTEDAEQGGGQVLDVHTLFETHPDEAIKWLQKHGVTKVGEFEEVDAVALPAFAGSPLLTLGSASHDLNVERVWRNRLRQGQAKPTGWASKVVLEAFVVNVRAAADPDKDGLLQPLLKRWQAGGAPLAIFGLPAVQATISFKWHVFARTLLLVQLGIFGGWVVTFFAFTALLQDEDPALSLRALLATARGRATVALELGTLAFVAPFLVLEYGTLAAYGWRGWMNVWNALDVSTYGLQVAIVCMHLGRLGQDTTWLSVFSALQCILLLFRLQYFSRVFKSTRFAFLEALRDVVISISFFLAFLLLIMFAFGAAFHILFRQDQQYEEFSTLGRSFLTVFINQGSILDMEIMRSSHNPVTASALSVCYYFIMGMVLLNLLIGIMTTALEKASQHEALKMLLNKASIIDELEATFPRWIEDRFASEWYPPFIHILRIDPDRVDKPNLDLMWEKGEAIGTQAPKSADVAQELGALREQLARIEALLLAPRGGSDGGPAAT